MKSFDDWTFPHEDLLAYQDARVFLQRVARLRWPGGQAELYKDGYTDLRGRFDYASVNTGQLGGVQKFAILVLSEKHGSTVREAKPPKQ